MNDETEEQDDQDDIFEGLEENPTMGPSPDIFDNSKMPWEELLDRLPAQAQRDAISVMGRARLRQDDPLWSLGLILFDLFTTKESIAEGVDDALRKIEARIKQLELAGAQADKSITEHVAGAADQATAELDRKLRETLEQFGQHLLQRLKEEEEVKSHTVADAVSRQIDDKMEALRADSVSKIAARIQADLRATERAVVGALKKVQPEPVQSPRKLYLAIGAGIYMAGLATAFAIGWLVLH